MQCAAPNCVPNDSSFNSTQGITYFKFPVEPTLRAAWLERLNKRDWQPEENSAVCSKHFLPDDIEEHSNGLLTLRDGAMPAPNLEVCRICFALDCKLYPLTAYKTLYKAYETLTGLLIKSDNIPAYVCNECAHQLLKCARFRNKSLKAYSILIEISTEHKCITLESIKSIQRTQNPTSNEAHNQSEPYDIDMEVAEMENMSSNDQTNSRPIAVLPEQVSVECIKLESEETCRQSINSNISLSKNVMVHIAVEPGSQEDLSMDSCKTEDINMNQDEDSEVLKDKDTSKEIVEGVSSCLSLDDGREADETNSELQDVWVIEDDDPTKEDRSSETEREQNPSQDQSTVAISLGDGEQNAEKTVEDEQAIINVAQHVTNIQNSNDKASESAGSKEAEGDDSLPFGEVDKEKEMSFVRIHEIEIIIEKDKYAIDETHRNQDGISRENDKLTCDKCPFRCNSKVKMSSHLKAHAAPTSYNCSECNYKTVHRRNLAWHARVHTRERPFECKKCNKTFTQKCSLKVHMRQHSGKKPYSCNVCQRNFTDLSTLNHHLIIHSGEKPHVCDICHKLFRQIANLRSHLRRHTGEKSFVCDYCNKAFAQKAHLIKHIRIHTDDLRYACPICNKIFRSDITFANHMRKHSNKKSYSCKVCKAVFSQRSSLGVHWKKHT